MIKVISSNYADVTNIIGSIGFPCFMCVSLMYYIYKMESKTQELLSSLNTVVIELKGAIENVKE